MRLMTVVGTRPELIRLSETIKKCDEVFDHILVHTGQNYDEGLKDVFFRDLELREPDYLMNIRKDGVFNSIGDMLIEADRLILLCRPDAFLVLGDTNSCLTAYVAKRHQIPIFHMEAGNRCFDQRVPEEINRKIVDSLADVNICYSQISRSYLIREGFDPNFIVVSGSPMKQVLTANMGKAKRSQVLDKLGLNEGKFLVASIHREENVSVNENVENIFGAINEISKKHDIPVVVSVHPRAKKALENANVDFSDRIILSSPLGFHDYLKLQMAAFMVLSDSGTIFEEASILGFSALSVRTTHERPEALEQPNVILSGIAKAEIFGAYEMQSKLHNRVFKTVTDYNVEDVATKIVRLIQSFTPKVQTYKYLR